MKKRIALGIFTSLIFIFYMNARRYTVIDASDRSPIIGATVFANSGIIKGLTDNCGSISIDEKELPASISCIGYDLMTISSATDTISMTPIPFELNEIVLSPADRPIKQVVCFAREYSSGITGVDTMQYYCEYMAVAFLVDGKTKGYRSDDANPSTRGVKRYARIAKVEGDSVFRPKRDDDITELSWFDFMAFLPEKKVETPESIKNGAETDTVHGKYGPKFIYRKKNGQFTMTADVLSDHKNRKWSPLLFKLIGMTADITMGSWTLSFAEKESGSYGITEFGSGTYNIHLIGKGKWLKKAFGTKYPIEMDSYMEIYPLEITNLTVEEYKEARDEYAPLPFRYPDGLQPLSPAIQTLVERIDSI